MIGWDRDKSNKPTLNEWAYFYVCMSQNVDMTRFIAKKVVVSQGASYNRG
jgi:hypothetical protein